MCTPPTTTTAGQCSSKFAIFHKLSLESSNMARWWWWLGKKRGGSWLVSLVAIQQNSAHRHWAWVRHFCPDSDVQASASGLELALSCCCSRHSCHSEGKLENWVHSFIGRGFMFCMFVCVFVNGRFVHQNGKLAMTNLTNGLSNGGGKENRGQCETNVSCCSNWSLSEYAPVCFA